MRPPLLPQTPLPPLLQQPRLQLQLHPQKLPALSRRLHRSTEALLFPVLTRSCRTQNQFSSIVLKADS